VLYLLLVCLPYNSYGTLKDDHHLYFVLSYGGTELSRYITIGRSIAIDSIRRYALQLASVGSMCHIPCVICHSLQ
jgi:hypothetical protein